MALFVKQDEERSQLQQKIAADIEERQRAQARADANPPDGVNDSQFIKGTSHMSAVGIVLLVVLVLIVIGIVIFVNVR